MRLNKFIAHCGYASRRAADKLIEDGRVMVNSQTVVEQGLKIDPENDIVEIDGERLGLEEKNVYILLNKPEGYITTVKDQFDRPSVTDLIKDYPQRLYPVGRLDFDTSGLLIMTNDGDLTYRLTHPKHEADKTYDVIAKGIITEKQRLMLERGVYIDDVKTYPARVKIRRINEEKEQSYCSITIHEGRNRQVRKMFKAVGHPVRRLKRIAIGKIRDFDLKPGEYRELTDDEIAYLKSI